MNDFNINPDYKKYRQNQKNKAAKLHKLKVFVALFSVMLIFASVISVLVFSGVFDKTKDQSSTEAPSARPTNDEGSATVLPQTEKKEGVTVFIDPGHGYHNSDNSFNEGIGNGSAYYDVSGGKSESDFTLQIALKLRDILKAQGYEVLMFREDTVSAAINDEYSATIANGRFADVCVSIHGRSGMPNERGTAVIYSNKHQSSEACKDLALAVASAIDKTSGIVSKNKVDIEIRDLPICVKTNMPSIEVEALYLTNDQDAKLAVSDSWQQYFAQAVADGITAQFPLEK